MTPARAPESEPELEELISRPPDFLASALDALRGDIVVLGAGGKMGSSLARMAKRANPDRRVVAVSRWSDARVAERLGEEGVETMQADLIDPRALSLLPDAGGVVFMAGQKFGTSDDPSSTWAMNAAVPAFVAHRYAGVRTTVFSTGNVYPLSRAEAGGSRESDQPEPVGEYAYSCLARERLFAAACARHGTPVSIVRLNYAHDLRYGVLTDIATRIARGEAIDRGMSHVNVLWQGDANAFALASLVHAATPEPFVLNVAGVEILEVERLARALGERLGLVPTFVGEPSGIALLSNAARMVEMFGDPTVGTETLLDWVAAWVQRGGRLLGKPTGFERRDGRF